MVGNPSICALLEELFALQLYKLYLYVLCSYYVMWKNLTYHKFHVPIIYHIRYFLPEDGDHEDAPNVFMAPKPSRPGYPPLLGQIKDSFPLQGSYHFRFKTALVPGTDRDKNAVPVWMDCVGDSQCVPVWQGSIIAKVTRISLDDYDGGGGGFDEDFDRSGHSRAESNVSAASSVHSTAQPKTTTASTQSIHSSDSLLGAFDDPPAPAPAASAASSVHSSADNLLDVDHHHPPAPASGGSLLDMDHHLGSTSGSNTPASAHNDLLNMSAPVHQHHHAPSQPQQQPMQQPPMQQQPQYPMQYPPQQQHGQYPGQGMAQMPAPQQQHQQRSMQNGNKSNAFDKFSDPMANLNWS